MHWTRSRCLPAEFWQLEVTKGKVLEKPSAGKCVFTWMVRVGPVFWFARATRGLRL